MCQNDSVVSDFSLHWLKNTGFQEYGPFLPKTVAPILVCCLFSVIKNSWGKVSPLSKLWTRALGSAFDEKEKGKLLSILKIWSSPPKQRRKNIQMLNLFSFTLHISPFSIAHSSPMSARSQLQLLSIFTFLLPVLPFIRTTFAALPIIPINGSCHDTCGTIPVKYPFGTGFGCGHPDFSRYIKCSSSSSPSLGTLQFSSGTGVYDVSSIDYASGNMVLTDPLMSTCSSMQDSGGFSLDRDSPFTLTDDNIFVLLGCSRTSPVFDPDEDLCGTGSVTRVCKGLYSCKAVTGIGLAPNGPTSTCCVYESPSRFTSGGYSLDVPKLQCSSYSTIYGFGDDRGNPMKWKFGISLKYNDSYYTDSCKDCESSGGSCGFSGLGGSFACICPNGVNSTNNCYGRGYALSATQGYQFQTWISTAGFLLLWIMLFT